MEFRPMTRMPAFAISTALMLGLSACTTLVGVDPTLTPAQRDQVQRDMPRPLVTADARYEWVTVESDIPVPRDAFAHWFMQTGAAHLAVSGNGTPTLPGIDRAELLGDTWHAPGDRRRVVFTDGHSAVEEVIDSLQAHQFRYVSWNRSDRIGRYTRYAVGTLTFSESALGTHVHWTYAFRPKVWPDGLLIRNAVRTEHHDFLAAALAAMREHALADLQEN